MPSLQREDVRAANNAARLEAETAKARMAAALQEVEAKLAESKEETAAARERLSKQARYLHRGSETFDEVLGGFVAGRDVGPSPLQRFQMAHLPSQNLRRAQ